MQRVTIWRRLVQVPFFLVTGTWFTVGALRCPFGVPFISCTSCPLTDCPGRYLQIPFIGIIGASAVLFGRSFCGWACPFGFINDILGRIPKFRATVSKGFTRLDRWLKPLKYVALVVVGYFIFALNYPVDRAHPYVVRTANVFNLQSVRIAQELGSPVYEIRMWILVGVLLLALFVTRFSCRYLCPLGAILGLFNKFSLFGIVRERQDLPRCGKYPRECSQHTMPGTLDCIMCGECVEGCPREILALRSRFAKKDRPQEETTDSSDARQAVRATQ